MIRVLATSKRQLPAKSLLALSFVVLGALSGSEVLAYGEGDMITTLRTPLIYGAPNDAPGYVPMEGAPPPIGSGDCPVPVTPGMWGPPTEPASHIPGLPLVDGAYKHQIDPYIQGYLTPPPSTEGYNMGSINGSNGGYGLPAPVCEVNINPQGGISGTAPTQRWGGQTSRDLGRNSNTSNGNSSFTFDFGQKLSQKPDLRMTPQTSQDGPRLTTTGMDGTRCPNLPSAQQTALRYGNRIKRLDGQSAQLTIAPY